MAWDPPAADSRMPVAAETMPPAPATLDRPAAAAAPKRRARRPKFTLVVAFAVLLRGGREVAERLAWHRYGWLGVLAVSAVGIVVVLAWRLTSHQRTKRQGGEESTDEQIRRQIADSGLPAPAFAGDGTLLGAPIVVVNQRTKLIEVNTHYDLYGADGLRLGHVEQIGQSRGKRAARLLTSFDQFFTHHFDVYDANDALVLRITRPRKFLLTKVHVFDAHDHFVGTIRQRNVFGRIGFDLVNERSERVGNLQATNLKAWDFSIRDAYETELASAVKTWEGWARTAFTRSDRYVVRIHVPLAEPMRSLTVAAALSIDLALKQDARSFG